jgi:hypothetical protein
MESHDALLFSIPISKLIERCRVIQEEMERPIDFSRCSLPRHELVIPCEIETGKNYRDLKKFKDLPIIMPPKQIVDSRPKSVTESFLADTLPEDSRLDSIIYEQQRRKFEV